MPLPASSRDRRRRSAGTAKSTKPFAATCPRERAACGEAIKLSRREMTKSRNPRSRFTARQLGKGAILTALALLGGCKRAVLREFYREWANQDVSEVVFEKSRDPRAGGIDLFLRWSSPRFRGTLIPTDQEVPPAPPDDPAAERSRPCRSGPTTGCSFRPKGPATSICSNIGGGNSWRSDGPPGCQSPRMSPNTGNALTMGGMRSQTLGSRECRSQAPSARRLAHRCHLKRLHRSPISRRPREPRRHPPGREDPTRLLGRAARRRPPGGPLLIKGPAPSP